MLPLKGRSLAEAFRASHPKVQVIYAFENPNNDERRVAGSVFLSKPVMIPSLLAACRGLAGISADTRLTVRASAASWA